MKILQNNLSIPEPLGMALGNFDGLHKAHRALIEYNIKRCKEKNLASAVLTIHPHPSVYFQTSKAKQILSVTRKKELLQAMGVDYYIELPFDEQMANMSSESFVRDVLKKRFQVDCICVGHDYAFGKRKEGNVDVLERLQQKYDFLLYVQPEMTQDQMRISSTAIRDYIRQGQVASAARMLGYFPMVEGKVVTGNHLGKTLGFPTANMKVNDLIVTPKKGVYLGYARLAETKDKDVSATIYDAMISVGYKPTIGDQYHQNIEAHIFNFSQDVYEKDLQVSFRLRMRDEIKFETVDALVGQLKKDQQDAQKALQKEEKIAAFPNLLY